MKEPYVIRISSQKGGVGKTTLSVNLATALQTMRYSVLLVDTDNASPSVSEYFGIGSSDAGYVEALRGNIQVKDAIFAYEPIDLNVIAGTNSPKPYDPDPQKLVSDMENFYSQVKNMDYDFVIVDASPGPIPQSTAKFYNEILIVTTPERVSALGSKKLADQADKYHLKHRLAVNRTGYSRYELSAEDIEKTYGDLIDITIPEDLIISESVSKHKPAYLLDRDNPFSKAIGELSKIYTFRAGEKEDDEGRGDKGGFFGALGRIIGIK